MTQWLSAEELRSYQAPLIAKLLLHARKTTRFYKDRLDVDLSSTDRIWKTWTEIPVLDARRGDEAPRRADKPQAAARQRACDRGTDVGIDGGARSAYRKSEASVVAATALLERMFRWWSIDGQKTYAHIAPDGRRRRRPRYGRTYTRLAFASPRWNQALHRRSGRCGRSFAVALKRRPDYLATYAPVLKELAITAQKRGVELRFSQLMSFGTVLDDETRELCKAVFAAEIADTYGAQEVDQIAAQCHDCGEYHASAEATVVEVLRADNSAAAPGENRSRRGDAALQSCDAVHPLRAWRHGGGGGVAVRLWPWAPGPTPHSWPHTQHVPVSRRRHAVAGV